MRNDRLTLWLRWVGANAVAELIGLGSTFALLAFGLSRLGDGSGAAGVILSFLLAIATGAVEATVVGLAQSWAMSPWFPAITRRAWWLATLIGALVAYALGYLPSTLMGLSEPAAAAPTAEPPQWVVLVLAAAMGAVAGAVLSFAQYLALRRHIGGAGSWIPANMLAWMVGMPVIFWGVDLAQQTESPVQAVLLMAGVLLLTGAVVGAIHGAFLVRLAPSRRAP